MWDLKQRKPLLQKNPQNEQEGPNADLSLAYGNECLWSDGTIATELIPSQLAMDGNPISCITEGNIVLWIF